MALNRPEIRMFEYSPQTPTLISPRPGSGGFMVLSPVQGGGRGNPYQRVATLLSSDTSIGLVYVPPGSGTLVIDMPSGAQPPSPEQLAKWLNEHPKKNPGGPSLPEGPIIVKPD